MDALKKKIETNRSAILRELDLNKEFLALLTKNGVLDITRCVRLQQIEDLTERNETFLAAILTTEDDTLYMKLIESLQKSGQTKLANRLIDVGQEMLILNQMYTHLDAQLKQMGEFLTIEERRAGVYLTEPPMEPDNENPALTEAEVWSKVQESIKRSQQQLTRCQSVIKKLHQDCETVAKQNSDIFEYTKECDFKIKEVLSVGRQSAKKTTGAPKRTQDLFANLMNDIEKLVKTRKKVITKETEGRRHSTRIVRQCRDWLESRSLVLQKLNSLPGPGAYRSFDTPADGEIIHTQRAAPQSNDNAIMSIFDALQLLEKELQAYIHQEVTLTDKYRSEVRRKHLQKKIHGFNTQGIADMESAVKNLEKDPQALKDNVAIIQTCISEINREYGECVAYLNKMDLGNNEGDPNSSPMATRKDIRPTPRDWPGNFKKKPISMGGKVGRSLENNMNTVGLPGKYTAEQPNQLLDKVRNLVTKYEELKAEELNMSSKYRAELSKRKRDGDMALQRKEDQIMRLQTQLKETEAEKEKYKKLYNDTKIGYQRNRDAVTSPR